MIYVLISHHHPHNVYIPLGEGHPPLGSTSSVACQALHCKLYEQLKGIQDKLEDHFRTDAGWSIQDHSQVQTLLGNLLNQSLLWWRLLL